MSGMEVNAMSIDEWRTFVKTIVRGVRRQLCASAPRYVRKQLEDLEARLPTITGRRARNDWANELDSMADRIPCVHAAAGRYFAPKYRQASRMMNVLARKVDKLRMHMAKANKAQQGVPPYSAQGALSGER